MEGNKRELETDSGNHEREGADEKTRCGAFRHGCANVVEVERTAREGIYERETHQQNSRREDSCKNVLDSGLVALVVTLVECHHGCERQRGGLKTDYEDEEVACGNHEVHAEECHEQQLIELTFADSHLVALDPFGRLEKDDEDTDVENGLHCLAGSIAGVHTSEHCLAARGNQPDCHSGEAEQNRCERSQRTLASVACECVPEEHNEEQSQNYKFGHHRPKL